MVRTEKHGGRQERGRRRVEHEEIHEDGKCDRELRLWKSCHEADQAHAQAREYFVKSWVPDRGLMEKVGSRLLIQVRRFYAKVWIGD
jgi:hypothetical protein